MNDITQAFSIRLRHLYHVFWHSWTRLTHESLQVLLGFLYAGHGADCTRSSLWPELKVLETTLTKLWILRDCTLRDTGQHHARRTPQPTHPCH